MCVYNFFVLLHELYQRLRVCVNLLFTSWALSAPVYTNERECAWERECASERVRGREWGSEGGREGVREGGREGGSEGGRMCACVLVRGCVANICLTLCYAFLSTFPYSYIYMYTYACISIHMHAHMHSHVLIHSYTYVWRTLNPFPNSHMYYKHVQVLEYMCNEIHMFTPMITHSRSTLPHARRVHVWVGRHVCVCVYTQCESVGLGSKSLDIWSQRPRFFHL